MFPAQERTAYDLGSIMHYGTGEYTNDACYENKLDQCQFAVYKDANHHELGVEWMADNQVPSSPDAMWVKMMYPWKSADEAEADGDGELDRRSPAE